MVRLCDAGIYDHAVFCGLYDDYYIRYKEVHNHRAGPIPRLRISGSGTAYGDPYWNAYHCRHRAKILLPINRLREATKEVAKGNFNVQLYENIKIEEFREMAKDFNKMVQELQGIETLRTDFVTNVSHEFKTPITAIEGYAALLQNSDLPAEEREEYAGKIISSTRQLSMLTNNILKLSKLENQEIIIEKTEFSLDEQIRQALLLLEPQWSGKQLDLEIQLAETGFYGSEELLMQVWINILGNAVKFSREYGNLSVTLTESPRT